MMTDFALPKFPPRADCPALALSTSPKDRFRPQRPPAQRTSRRLRELRGESDKRKTLSLWRGMVASRGLVLSPPAANSAKRYWRIFARHGAYDYSTSSTGARIHAVHKQLEGLCGGGILGVACRTSAIRTGGGAIDRRSPPTLRTDRQTDSGRRRP